MSEIPERIEREMFEIRSRMGPDVQDLSMHTKPGYVGKQVSSKVRERLKEVAQRLGKELKESASHQAQMAGEAGRKRDLSRFTDAVKSDPRPLALLAAGLAVTAFVVRRATRGRE